MSLTVAILAGGLATRLRPLTLDLPKALIPVAGRPFIEHQILLLKKQGYVRAVLCLGYRGEMVEAHLGDGSRWSMELEYVFDGPQLLGTGGALRKALPVLGEAFLILYGDSYLLCDFAKVEESFVLSGMPALMTVYRNKDRWDRSNVVYRDGRILRHDKRSISRDMEYIDYGLGAMSAEALRNYPNEGSLDLSDIYSDLAKEGRLAGFEVAERFYEIGSPAGLAAATKYLVNLVEPAT